VKQGKALYGRVHTGAAEAALKIVERERLAPITIHQPYYNMLGRTIETDLLPHTDRAGGPSFARWPRPAVGHEVPGRHVPADTRPAREWAKHWSRGNR
jgi:aryl-alcohol dehydrogenase-like predicted oxidoreductase